MAYEIYNNRRIYSLLELGESIQAVIARTYDKSYLIKAEVLKLNYYPASGHCYPDLIEKKEGKITAQMRAIIWKDDFIGINKKFQETIGELLKEGVIILCYATVQYSPTHGLSLAINDIEPAYTLGEIERLRKETINRLKQESVFALNKSKEIPLLPQNIAIISINTSKGYNDFMVTIGKSNYHFNTTLFPSLLQGDNAPKQLVSQLNNIALSQNNFDLVAIIRGGGGDAGLSCYNDYLLAKTIAEFPIPVLTGIGHSTNETIAEMVSHTNKITPTELAYFLIEKFERFEKNINAFQESIANNSRKLLQLYSQRLAAISVQINSSAKRLLATTRSTLETQTTKLGILPEQIINSEHYKLRNIESKLHLLNPQTILMRGYSITQINGKSVTDSTGLSAGDTIETTLHKGRIKSTVKVINHQLSTPI